MNEELNPEDSQIPTKSYALKAAEGLRAAASEQAQKIKNSATEHAQQIKNAATEKAQKIKNYAEHSWGDAKVKLKDLHSEGENYVRENPSKSVLTALGVGFVLGLLFRR